MSSSPESSPGSSQDGGPVFWFTGLSGAGKTTVADAARARLAEEDIEVILLDGDEVRRKRKTRLGFSRGDVLTNNAEVAALCLLERRRADAVFVPIISPFAEGRAAARAAIGEGFYEIHFSADRQCVALRDVKGLYAKAARGEAPAMIGFSPGSPYEPPTSPDLSLDSAAEKPEDSAEKLTRFVLANL